MRPMSLAKGLNNLASPPIGKIAVQGGGGQFEIAIAFFAGFSVIDKLIFLSSPVRSSPDKTSDGQNSGNSNLFFIWAVHPLNDVVCSI